MPNQDNSLREIEIKLSASEKTLDKIVNNTIFTRYSEIAWQQKKLLNQYIDSIDYHLTHAKVALRVRQDGDQYIQTLKSKGSSIGGFSARDEFDWYLNSPQLDISLLVSPYWPKSLEGFNKSDLAVIFSTDFTRKYTEFKWLSDNGEAQIEVAIDRGVVQAKERQTKICELELELKSGDAKSMLDFAIELATHFPLIPSNLSKAERGYRLIDPNGYKTAIKALSTKNSLDEQIEYYVANSQYYWESYCWQADSAKLKHWIDAIQKLYALLTKQKMNELADQLEPILSDWLSIINESSDRLHDKVLQELDNTRWGVFLLSVLRWLLNRH